MRLALLVVTGMLLVGAETGTASAERASSAEAASLVASVAQAGDRATTAAKRAGKSKKAKKKKQRKLNRKIAKKVKNGHYVGTRGDGLAIDKYVCAKKIRDGLSTYRNWKVTNAKRTKRGFTAIVQAKVKGGKYAFAIAKVRKRWKIGIEHFGAGREFGNVKRTNARKECKGI